MQVRNYSEGLDAVFNTAVEAIKGLTTIKNFSTADFGNGRLNMVVHTKPSGAYAGETIILQFYRRDEYTMAEMRTVPAQRLPSGQITHTPALTALADCIDNAVAQRRNLGILRDGARDKQHTA